MRERDGEGAGTRAALILAAAELLEGWGMEAVTLRAVGERAGVSRQAPYKHFADKGALLSVVAAGFFGRLGEEMAAAAEGAGEEPFGRLAAMGEAYVRFALANPNRYRLMFGPEMRSIPFAEVHEAAHAVYERFVQAVADSQETGRLPEGDPVELAALLYATSHGAVDLTLAGQAAKSKGLDDPLALLRSLLVHLRTRGDD